MVTAQPSAQMIPPHQELAARPGPVARMRPFTLGGKTAAGVGGALALALLARRAKKYRDNRKAALERWNELAINAARCLCKMEINGVNEARKGPMVSVIYATTKHHEDHDHPIVPEVNWDGMFMGPGYGLDVELGDPDEANCKNSCQVYGGNLGMVVFFIIRLARRIARFTTRNFQLEFFYGEHRTPLNLLFTLKEDPKPSTRTMRSMRSALHKVTGGEGHLKYWSAQITDMDQTYTPNVFDPDPEQRKEKMNNILKYLKEDAPGFSQFMEEKTQANKVFRLDLAFGHPLSRTEETPEPTPNSVIQILFSFHAYVLPDGKERAIFDDMVDAMMSTSQATPRAEQGLEDLATDLGATTRSWAQVWRRSKGFSFPEWTPNFLKKRELGKDPNTEVREPVSPTSSTSDGGFGGEEFVRSPHRGRSPSPHGGRSPSPSLVVDPMTRP